jgi:hypothetical protein
MEDESGQVSEVQVLDDYVSSSKEADIAESFEAEDRARMMLAEDEMVQAGQMVAQDAAYEALQRSGGGTAQETEFDYGEWTVNESE